MNLADNCAHVLHSKAVAAADIQCFRRAPSGQQMLNKLNALLGEGSHNGVVVGTDVRVDCPEILLLLIERLILTVSGMQIDLTEYPATSWRC